MPFVTTAPTPGNPVSNSPVGAFGANLMQTGWLPGNLGRVFTFIENLSASSPLFISFGGPVAANQYHVVLNASGVPFTDPGMIKGPIYISGGSYLAWSM